MYDFCNALDWIPEQAGNISGRALSWQIFVVFVGWEVIPLASMLRILSHFSRRRVVRRSNWSGADEALLDDDVGDESDGESKLAGVDPDLGDGFGVSKASSKSDADKMDVERGEALQDSTPPTDWAGLPSMQYHYMQQSLAGDTIDESRPLMYMGERPGALEVGSVMQSSPRRITDGGNSIFSHPNRYNTPDDGDDFLKSALAEGAGGSFTGCGSAGMIATPSPYNLLTAPIGFSRSANRKKGRSPRASPSRKGKSPSSKSPSKLRNPLLHAGTPPAASSALFHDASIIKPPGSSI